jgi:hypothetical protein
MLKLKFSPLLLFIILLVVLIFSTIICKTCFLNASKTEGFVSFQKDKDTTSNTNTLYMVNLPQYSKTNTVAKLYDNLFFDKLNGNLIEIDSKYYVTSGNVSGNVSTIIDTTGSSISNIYINTRSNTNRSYPTLVNDGNVVGMDVAESLSNTMTSSFTNWSYVTTSLNTDNYQVFYMPWGDTTYMHIIKLKNYQSSNFSPTHIMSFMFGPGGSMSNKYYSLQTAAISIKNDDNDPSNDKYVYDDYYDTNKSVYQLSKYVKFDRSNGNLIIRSDSGIKIYDRNNSITTYDSKGKVTNTSTTLQNSDFNSFVVSDNYKYIVLYLPISTKTMIALLKIDPSNSNRFKIEKVVRFNKDGIETDSGTNTNSGVTQPKFPNDQWNDFYQNYWMTFSNSGNQYMSEDYLLKTQIVPPVCPSCPSCAYSAGTCTNCGGAGGSGTLNSNGQTVVENGKVPTNVTGTALVTSGGAVVTGTTGSDKPVSNAVDQTTNTLNTSVGTAGVLGSKTLDTTSDILKSTGSGATDLLKSTGSGASDLLKSGASGATDLLKSTASGATNLLKSTASGATDLLKSAGSGLKDIATDNRKAAEARGVGVGGVGGGGVGGVSGAGIPTRGVAGIDNYSYYGALPSKGGNYMPITADFSAFAK